MAFDKERPMSEHKVKEATIATAKTRPERCETCAFYEEFTMVTGQGVCHRQPPDPAIAAGPGPDGKPQVQVLGSGWPPVPAVGWCGEWKQGTIVKPVGALPSNVSSFPRASRN